MLTNEQKHFRKEMKAIRKEKGDRYNEIYNTHTPHRQVKNARPRNYNTLIRVALFLVMIIGSIYRSGFLTPIIKGQEAVSSYSSKKPRILKGVATPLSGKQEQGCSDYLQTMSVISQELTQVVDDYMRETASFISSKDEIGRLRKDLEQIEVIKHGEGLRDAAIEHLDLSLYYIEVVESLRITQAVNTANDLTAWENKREFALEIHDNLSVLVNRYMKEMKALLKKYDMGYIESENGIEYFYNSERPSSP